MFIIPFVSVSVRPNFRLQNFYPFWSSPLQKGFHQFSTKALGFAINEILGKQYIASGRKSRQDMGSSFQSRMNEKAKEQFAGVIIAEKNII